MWFETKKLDRKVVYKIRAIHLLFLLLLMQVIPSISIADDPKAREIMKKVDARDDGDNQYSDMEMVLIDKRGNQRIRRIRSLKKYRGEDIMRLMFFIHPADVKDTGFLTYDYDDAEKDDDQWLYLPALRKTKRIASSDKTSAFMGSDFSYADMTKKEPENYNYSLLKESTVGEHEVWIIKSIPVNERVIDQYGYTKTVSFVRKDNFVVIRSVSWEKDINKIKYMNIKKLDLIDGIWVPTEMHMTLRKGKSTIHKTIMRLSNVRFNQDLRNSIFTVRYLEKGVPK